MGSKRARASVRREKAGEADIKGNSEEASAGEGTQGPALIGTIGVDYTVGDYLSQRGLRCREKDGGYFVACPACKSRRVLRIDSEIGTFACGSCSRSGSFRELRLLFGDSSVMTTSAHIGYQFEIVVPDYTPVPFHRDYTSSLHGADGKGCHGFLAACGISDPMMRSLRLGYSKDWDAVVFPYLYERRLGSCSYIRFLREPGDWWKVSGDPKNASFFGQHLFKTGHDEAIITENPLDASILLSIGETNAMSCHSDGAVRLRAHQLALLQRCSVVYLYPTPTDSGMRWALKMRDAIGRWRCQVVQTDRNLRELVMTDKTELYFQAKGRAASSVGIYTRKATDWMSDLDQAWSGAEDIAGFPTKLEPLDKLLGGWRRSEVTVLGGPSGVGKSTLAVFLALLHASGGRPTLFASFEVLPRAILKKWACMLAGESVTGLERRAYINVRKKLAKRPLFVADTYGMVDIREVRRTVYDTVQRHGVSMIVLDHLGHLSAGEASPDVRETGTIVREIKRWSLDLGVHILLVAHLRKPPNDSRRAAQMEDLRGSGEIYQTADNVFLIDRKRASESSELTLRLVKVRDDQGYEGTVKLSFDQASLVYSPS